MLSIVLIIKYTESPYLFAVSLRCYPICCLIFPLEKELHRGHQLYCSAASKLMQVLSQCEIKSYLNLFMKPSCIKIAVFRKRSDFQLGPLKNPISTAEMAELSHRQILLLRWKCIFDKSYFCQLHYKYLMTLLPLCCPFLTLQVWVLVTPYLAAFCAFTY